MNAAEIEELRRTSPAEKIAQTAALMTSIESIGWQLCLTEENQQVLERWRNLRKAFHAV